jgi:hypothetical protein
MALNSGPPQRPASGLGAGANHPGSFAPSTPIRTIAKSSRPSLPLFLIIVLNTSISIYLFLPVALDGNLKTRAAGLISGMFFGIILLGLFRQDFNKKRSSGLLADWRFLSSTIVNFLSIVAWLVAFINASIVAKFIARWLE